MAGITVFGTCPVQGEGYIQGHPWYFRARHKHWSLEVSYQVGNLIESDSWSIGNEYDGASHMPHEEAVRLIEHGLAVFTFEVLGTTGN